MSIIKSNGDVNIPEPLIEQFKLLPGSNVTFIDLEGKHHKVAYLQLYHYRGVECQYEFPGKLAS